MRIFRKLAQLLDVDLTTNAPADGDSLTYDSASETWVPEAVSGGAGSDNQTASEVPFTPAGDLSSTNVQDALEEVDTEKASQTDIDSSIATHSADTTSVHGIADTSALYRSGGTDVAVADGGTGASTAAAARTNLGLVIGTDVQAHDADLDTYAGITPSSNVQSLLGAADYAAIRTLLGLVIGTNVQAFDADLSTWAGLTPSAFFQTLVDDADAATARTTLGATTAAAALTAAQTEIADQKRVVEILVSDPGGSAITTGDGKAYFRVPSLMNGHNLVSVAASVSTVSSSGTPTVQIRNATQSADMLTTRITIDANETDSSTAATAAVIDTGNDDVATGDQIYIDVDVAGTGTKGLLVSMTFEAP